ncbi:MAG TPA: sodium/proton-translocating pyrophosphatase, partial [Candidatus Thermoplasmatota archaeon]|nr:sodium/proton-translocating pyrophosphatase [Candidatus Thermoplasmatota archaeon]
ILGVSLATDCYGPVADNAQGISEMAGMGKEVRENTEQLDAVGNTTAAMGKGFAIGSAAITALALIFTYITTAGAMGYSLSLDLADPNVVVGVFIGAMLPFVFTALTMGAVGRAAYQMVEEVRRQFKELDLLNSDKNKPDYKGCVAISTKQALKEMVLPSVLAVISPIIVGIILKPEGLGGLLVGSIATGFLLAVFLANSGGAWDNAKKYVESGNLGGKGSDAHKATVIGDTVGDPFKDTSGPSLNILIKLMSIVSLVFLPLIISISG